VALLQVAHPQHPATQQVENQLQGLANANFMSQDPEEPNTWRFCQVCPLPEAAKGAKVMLCMCEC
jgi:hypothetical protein